MLATQPFSNVRRALQMSSTSPITLTPTASILRHLRVGQMQHDVDVVDHHVQHHADIDAAEGQRADSGDFDEARADCPADPWPERRD